jgi:hypothetical protein
VCGGLPSCADVAKRFFLVVGGGGLSQSSILPQSVRSRRRQRARSARERARRYPDPTPGGVPLTLGANRHINSVLRARGGSARVAQGLGHGRRCRLLSRRATSTPPASRHHDDVRGQGRAAAACFVRVAAQLESRKDSGMVVAAGFSASARPRTTVIADQEKRGAKRQKNGARSAGKTGRETPGKNGAHERQRILSKFQQAATTVSRGGV